MAHKFTLRILVTAIALGVTGAGAWHAEQRQAPQPGKGDSLEQRFAAKVQPFVESYCVGCHGGKKPKAQLDLSRDLSIVGIIKNMHHWETVLERLEANDMPPESAAKQPGKVERAAVIAWLRELRDREAEKNAGDPGIVLRAGSATPSTITRSAI